MFRSLPNVTQLQLTAEILHIIRPALYVTGVLRYSLRSWKPFFMALFADVLSRVVIERSTVLSPRQRQEVYFISIFVFICSLLLRRLVGGRFSCFSICWGRRVLKSIPWPLWENCYPCVKNCLLSEYYSVYTLKSFVTLSDFCFAGNCLELAETLQNHYFYISSSWILSKILSLYAF